jgi:YesN/AraC family two-component response regulator
MISQRTITAMMAMREQGSPLQDIAKRFHISSAYVSILLKKRRLRDEDLLKKRRLREEDLLKKRQELKAKNDLYGRIVPRESCQPKLSGKDDPLEQRIFEKRYLGL